MTAPTGAPGSVVPPEPVAPSVPAPARVEGIEGDLAIALLLRSGTLVSGLLLACGLVAAAVAGRTLHPEGLAPARLFRLEAEWPELLAGAGVVALCLMPIARVAIIGLLHAAAKERGAALVAAGVLALLLVGVVLGGWS